MLLIVSNAPSYEDQRMKQMWKKGRGANTTVNGEKYCVV